MPPTHLARGREWQRPHTARRCTHKARSAAGSRWLPDDGELESAPCRHTRRPPSRRSGNSARSAQPRLIDGRPRQAGLLARGLESCIAFPNRVIQWPIDAGAPLTVAGAARALNPSSLSIPVGGTCRACVRCRKLRGGSIGAALRVVAAAPVIGVHQSLQPATARPLGHLEHRDAGRTPAHGRDTAPPPASMPAGMRSSSRSASGSNSDTHPMPTPSARAASHMF